MHERKVYLLACPVSGRQVASDVKQTHGGVTKVLASDGACLMLGEGVYFYGYGLLAFLFLMGLALGDETRVVLLSIAAAAILHILPHVFLVKLVVVAHHALAILNHGREHGCQLVSLLLAETRQLTKAKNTTMPGLAILVDVRLRETIVIVLECRAVSLIAIFLCCGYIHCGGKGTHIFSTGKMGGCSISGVFPNSTSKLGFFMQKTSKIGAKLPRNYDFVENV